MRKHVLSAIAAMWIALGAFHLAKLFVPDQFTLLAPMITLFAISMLMTVFGLISERQSSFSDQCFNACIATTCLLVWSFSRPGVPRVTAIIVLGVMIVIYVIYMNVGLIRLTRGYISFRLLVFTTCVQMFTVFYALRAGSEDLVTSISHAVFGSLLLLSVLLIERLPTFSGKLPRRDSN